MVSWHQQSPQALKRITHPHTELKTLIQLKKKRKEMHPSLEMDTLLGTYGMYCRQLFAMLGLRWVCVCSVFTWQPSVLSAAALQKWSPHRARDLGDLHVTDLLMASSLNSGSRLSSWVDLKHTWLNAPIAAAVGVSAREIFVCVPK